MPLITTTSFGGPKRVITRFKVVKTGEIGSAVSKNGYENTSRLVTIGPKDNIVVIDLCMDDTGEVRTFLESHLEELPDPSE